MITAENATGATSKIRGDWDEFIGIELGEDLKVKNYGLITRSSFDEEQTRKNNSLESIFNRRMFSDRGLFKMAGILFPAEHIEQMYLLK